MFRFFKTQQKHTHYIDNYNYPVGMDTRPTITFGVADNIFSSHPSSSWKFSFRGFITNQFFSLFKKWRAGHDHI